MTVSASLAMAVPGMLWRRGGLGTANGSTEVLCACHETSAPSQDRRPSALLGRADHHATRSHGQATPPRHLGNARCFSPADRGPSLRQTLALLFQTQCCEDLRLHFPYSFKNSQLCSEDPRPLGCCLLSPRLAVPWIPSAGAH